jgi:hypothetical protein
LKSLKKSFKRAERTFNGAEHGMYLRESSMELMIRRMDENGKQIVHVTGVNHTTYTGILLETEMNMQYFFFKKMKQRHFCLGDLKLIRAT